MSFRIPFFQPKKGKKKKGKSAASRVSPRSRPVARAPLAPPPLEPTLWESLSPERKLDIYGILLAVAGILIGLTLFASSRSAITGSFLRLLGQLIGWGIYILPVVLIPPRLWIILLT